MSKPINDNIISRVLRSVVFALLAVSITYPALSEPINKAAFIPLLIGARIHYQPLSAVEILAMEPACLQIGLGMAIPDHWGVPGRDPALQQEIVDEPQYAMLWVDKSRHAYAQWFHHYCWGQVAKIRYQMAIEKTKRQQYLTQWQDDLEYCLRSSKGTNWIYENHTRIELAKAYSAAKEFYKAQQLAESVVESDPTDLSAQIMLIDCLKAQDENKNALSVATSALTYNPDSKELLLRYQELGGKMPPSISKTSEPIDNGVSIDANGPVQKTLPGDGQNNNPVESNGQAGAEVGGDGHSRSDSGQAPVDSDKQRGYCRFCP